MKIRTLVGEFRGERVARVHPSALEPVLTTLVAWGIEYSFPSGNGGNDYITLAIAGSVSPSGPESQPTSVPEIRATNRGFRLQPGREYRVLSIHPPWAWAIIYAGKNVENRSWVTRYRGPILIHASSRKYVGVNLEEVRAEIARCSRLNESEVPRVFPSRQILGVVDLVDCVERSTSSWADPGQRHWLLKNPRPLERPVTSIDGKLNLWKWINGNPA